MAWIRGTQNDDVLFGTAFGDYIFGYAGNDILVGGDGDDGLSGGEGNDLLNGGAGDDILDGGEGQDTLTGGDGSDVFALGDLGVADVLADYDFAEGDEIDLTQIFEQVASGDTAQEFIDNRVELDGDALNVDANKNTTDGAETTVATFGVDVAQVSVVVDDTTDTTGNIA